MLIKSLIYRGDYLTTASEKAILAEALKILEGSSFRCAPILGDTETVFRGDTYKTYIYRHKSRGGDMNLPVTYLFKNATKTTKVNSSPLRIFFNIEDLPYIIVLDEGNHFYGTLTHAHLLDMLSNAWNIKNGSYVLTILSGNDRGNPVKIAEVISKYSNIAGYPTLDVKTGELIRRNLFTLPISASRETMTAIVSRLEKKGFVAPEIEGLQPGLTIRSAEQPGESKD